MMRRRSKRPKYDETHGTYRVILGLAAPLGVVAVLEEDEEDEE